jgi:hypothetical protein
MHISGDNIKMNLRRKGCETVDWIHLAQDAIHWRDLGFIEGGEFLDRLRNYKLPQGLHGIS